MSTVLTSVVTISISWVSRRHVTEQYVDNFIHLLQPKSYKGTYTMHLLSIQIGIQKVSFRFKKCIACISYKRILQRQLCADAVSNSASSAKYLQTQTTGFMYLHLVAGMTPRPSWFKSGLLVKSRLYCLYVRRYLACIKVCAFDIYMSGTSF